MNQDHTVLVSLVTQAAESLSLQVAIKLEKPNNPDFGDLSTNVAMIAFPQYRDRYRSPFDLAEALRVAIQKFDTDAYFEEVSVLRPGFINFRCNQAYWLEKTKQWDDQSFVFHNVGQSQKAIVEYSSPNIAKPFSIGHLRSTLIGDSIANLLEISGYQVFRDNHVGDWGTQFGKQIVAIKRWGDEQVISQSPEPVKELVALYVRFHEEATLDSSLEDEAREWFSKLEQGDQEARRLWKQCIDWSFVEFKRIYEYLGITFTENNGYGYGESYFEPLLNDLITELKQIGLAKEGEEGAILIFYPNDEYTPLMIAKKDGSTLYATRDLATDKWRKDNPRYQNDDGSAPLVINEVGSEQSFYFQQLYRAEELLGWYDKTKRIHVKHGLYRFKEGKMSTRKGNVVWLQEVLDRAKERSMEINDDPHIAQAVSIAALKWNDLKRKSDLSINFDWDELINLQGNSGPYMLYTYARARSVLRKAGQANDTQQLDREAIDFKLDGLEKDLLVSLEEFYSVVQKATQEYAPHHLCTYLFGLAQVFNSFYNHLPILKDEQRKQLRLSLVDRCARVLNQGLALLGIQTLEQM